MKASLKIDRLAVDSTLVEGWPVNLCGSVTCEILRQNSAHPLLPCVAVGEFG